VGSKLAVVFLIISLSLSFVSSAVAMSEKEREFLLLYFDEEDLVIVSTTRSLKSITRVAENVEVVTAADMELMNAHTVADALFNVVGVQMRIIGGPGAFAFTNIQGSDFRHVAVFMDGIPLNLFSDNVADVAAIPVQLVDKIEVIKGPASSTWGSSLGGVVNIITKSGTVPGRSGGTLYGSTGEQSFADLRADVYGKKEKTGYYLYAGRLQSDGFRGLPKNSDIAFNNYYLKLSHDISANSSIEVTTFYNRGTRGEGNPDMDFVDNTEVENLYASLSLKTDIGQGMKLYVSARSALRDWRFREVLPSTGDSFKYHSKDNAYGASAKITWEMESHAIVAGIDYDEGTVRIEDTFRDPLRDKIRKLAFFTNDTISLGKFSITPGIRFDHDRVIGDFVSPSVGITYDILEKTLLRTYVARGFNSPPSPWTSDNVVYGYKGNPNLKPEKVISYHSGIETGILKYLWLKFSVFRHYIRDAVVSSDIDEPPFSETVINKDEVRRQGGEVQFKTVPFYNVTFSGGAAFNRSKNLTDREVLKDVPRYTYDFGVKYEDGKSWKAVLKGHYIWWNSSNGGDYSSMVIDANVIKNIYKQNGRAADFFLTGHNIFDANQFKGIYYKFPHRWIEAGVKFRF
jgi:vitamin B12 transporter